MLRRQGLEQLLEQRGWGATLAAAVERRPPGMVRGHAPAAALEALERHGPERGCITQLLPPPGGGAGVTSAALRLAMRWQRQRGEEAACESGVTGARGALTGEAALGPAPMCWMDPLDQWDPDSAERAGVALEQVLWLRGSPALRGLAGLSRWHEILGVVVHSGLLPLVVMDFLDWPLAELRRTPRSAWFRLQRALERTRQTALVVLAPAPLTPGCAARVVQAAAEVRQERLA